ncbi:putative hydroxybutyrate dehydrogenase [Aspergillus japonicus CBS 114.51]|uniref:Putative hydroxybutyrate dehydrogenase n=1 Tax=Aspergillus japonicus CBS 114.51 TaxID=1448312 RepID=A0A8T8WUC4_ASPJA|nr:putative hydroxybutyrate dehydrogenase [Aspergillus japonicus CBS 114.51]RAH79260.1 putative hydroxybutyrate dehydrogenase [Aspergillus japonicus CBS 114.51]
MSKKSVLIIGCSNDGIGYGLAVHFQRRGFRVFATARSLSKMSNLEGLADVTFLELDICDQTKVKAAVDQVTQETGGELDYLVNNAGINHSMPLLDEDISTAKHIFETKVWGQLAVTLALAPLLIKARGAVVFITFIAGHVNVPYMDERSPNHRDTTGIYAASKRLLEIMAETLRLELAPFQVRVLSIVTGGVQTLGQSHFDEFALPEGAMYKSIEDTIAKRARGEDGKQRSSLRGHAEQVVTAIVAGTAGQFWCGQGAGATKFASTYLPTSWMGSLSEV